jgi:phenylpropionate dioxygenase-like ring-hydroxylating dioxygenase large terminal subunit
MISREENDRLTRVTGDAPMGRMMREHYWIPFALSSQLEPEGDPLPVTLLGENYVAFRAADGRIGFFDELCPHRRASLSLGRVEGNGIRCIFHAWKMDVSGKVVEAPTQLIKPQEFCERVKVAHFPVHEAGGLVWVWLGKAEQSPFPELPFVGEHEVNTWLSVTRVPCNWLQGVEGALDSAHVGVLHQSWVRDMGDLKSVPNIRMSLDGPPRYETQTTPYGLRAAALRERQDGRVYARTTEYFMPFVGLIPADRPAPKEGYLFIFAPVSDTEHLFFWGYYSLRRRRPPEKIGLAVPDFVGDRHEYAPPTGGAAARWGQDRAAMRRGHFTGFARTLISEDVAVQASMGPVLDRSRENVSSSDVAIVQTRRLLLKSLDAVDAGALPPGSALAAAPVCVTNPLDVVLEAGARWEDFGTDRAAAA